MYTFYNRLRSIVYSVEDENSLRLHGTFDPPEGRRTDPGCAPTHAGSLNFTHNQKAPPPFLTFIFNILHSR
jgi:hypothetical protein